ncbi:hypothetical protein MTR67_022954 [Solanum verrucosum]|uniref:Uncharacterized protein n=1 Tax=Solanum verrucosum TaxID=315347 RepID=A0AAF0R0Z3_SOLVR|nr:hypothetical protein MTR67_022954 [Solanum verrucosum]
MVSTNGISTTSILLFSSEQVLMQAGLKGTRVNLLQVKKFNNKASNSRLVARANRNDIAFDKKSNAALHSIVNKIKMQ